MSVKIQNFEEFLNNESFPINHVDNFDIDEDNIPHAIFALTKKVKELEQRIKELEK